MKIIRNSELVLAVCFCVSALADSASEKSLLPTSDIKSFCEAYYTLQEIYQSENGSYAHSFDALETKQNIRLPSLSGGYRPRLKAGQSIYKVFFTSPGKDTLVLSSSGDLKRGREVLLSLAPKEERSKIAVSAAKPKRKRGNVDEVPMEVQRSPARVTRIEDTTGIAINGKKYRLVKALARTESKSGMDETVEGIRILNSEDSICHDELWKFRPGPDGFESTRLANFVHLVGLSADGLLVVYDNSPAAPPSGTAFRIFGAGKGCMVPLSEEISISGYISGWKEGDSALRLENDILGIEIGTGYFHAVVPFKVDLAARTAPKQAFTLDPGAYNAKDRSLFLKISHRITKENYEEGAELDFSPVLPFKPKEKVKVPPIGKMEVLGVHLPAPGNMIISPDDILGYVPSVPDSMLVKVRLGPKTGWIKAEDMSKLGYPVSG
ncbi:MAG TPA: hypothetical protein VK465_17680 [Fibrobacteria bacterium]|nr:hypothetical protein [Fibrobacteria bacterium]